MPMKRERRWKGNKNGEGSGVCHCSENGGQDPACAIVIGPSPPAVSLPVLFPCPQFYPFPPPLTSHNG